MTRNNDTKKKKDLLPLCTKDVYFSCDNKLYTQKDDVGVDHSSDQ